MPTKRTKKPTTKKRQLPHALKAELKRLETALAAAEAAGMISGRKMARIQCPGCGTLDLGIAWSKRTGWAVLCDTCCAMTPLSTIDPPDPETREVGTREVVKMRSGGGTVQ